MRGMYKFSLLTALAMVLAPIAASAVEIRVKTAPLSLGFTGYTLYLLNTKPVQDDLRITRDQARRLNQLFEQILPLITEKKMNDRLEKFFKMAIHDVVEPEQVKRFNQIFCLQAEGERVFYDPEIAATLKLTPKQKESIGIVSMKLRGEVAVIHRKYASNPKEYRAKMAEQRVKTVAEMTGILEKEQKRQWQEMSGIPYKGDFYPYLDPVFTEQFSATKP